MATYFFDESGYVVNVTGETISFYTTGQSPIIRIVLTYDTMEELFSKIVSIAQFDLIGFAQQLPVTSTDYRTSITVNRSESLLTIGFWRTPIGIPYAQQENITLTFKESDMIKMAEYILEYYFEGKVSLNEID